MREHTALQFAPAVDECERRAVADRRADRDAHELELELEHVRQRQVAHRAVPRPANVRIAVKRSGDDREEVAMREEYAFGYTCK